MIITSKQNPHFKELKDLLTKKVRDEKNRFLIFGEDLFEIAEKRGKIIETFSTDANLYYDTTLSEALMKDLTPTVTSYKVGAILEKIDYVSNNNNNIIILDDVQDPDNVGAIFRSAACFNFDKLLLSNESADTYNDKTIRASRGGIFYLEVRRADLVEEIKSLKEKGYLIVGTEASGIQDLTKIYTSHKYAVIFGNEGKGIKKEILDLCDFSVGIKIDNLESLNVAHSASIIMHELRKNQGE
ncbi:MAG: RNA methyltransferase [Acholeplasmatales bacterium]|jgi:TrmH family RNA methyltransferase|nr:RNA methyltransferase [Acholeplasmatales bacterium]